MTISIEKVTNAELHQIINKYEKGQCAVIAPKTDYRIAKELLAVREAQSVPAPIAFSENADADMCRTWAWEQVKKDVTTDGWTIGDSSNFYGFYCWGWDTRRQYNEQRPPAVPDFGALTKLIVGRLIDCGTANDDSIADAEVFVYNACRAAMLNHSGDSNEKVPAGFKLVPAESNDAWAERYCELTNKHPDGGLTTYIGDGAVTITFREKSKREIDAMLAAAPTPTK